MPKLNEIIGEEAFKALPDGVKNKHKDTDFVDSTGYVEKSELDTANKTIKQYKKDIAKRDTDLTDLQDKAKGNEDLTAEIERLKEENKNTTKDYEAKLEKLNFDTKLDKALSGAKAKNPKTVKALLNIENLKLDGEDIIGLKEQLEGLKESDGYLFNEDGNQDNTGGNPNLGGTGSIGNPGSSGSDKVMNIGERLAKQRTEQQAAAKGIDDFLLK